MKALDKIFCIKTCEGMFGTFHKDKSYIIEQEETEFYYINYKKEDMIDYNNKSKKTKLINIAPGMRFYKKGFMGEDMIRTEYYDDYFIDIKKLRKMKLEKLDEND